MAISHTTAGLAESLYSWTGTVTATIGATVATAAPVPGDSAASLMARLVEACVTTHGGTWRTGVTTAGRVVLEGAAHTLAATGTTATRLGLTGSVGPLTVTTAQDVHAGGYYPAQGLAWSGAPGYQTQGRITGDGSQVVPGRPTTGQWSVDLRVAHADSWTVEQIDGSYDLHRAGRVFGRMSVGGVQRVPAGESPQGPQIVRVVGPGGVSVGRVSRRACEATEAIGGRITGWVDRTVPGYREIEVVSSPTTTPATYERLAIGIDLGDSVTMSAAGHTLTMPDEGSIEYVDWIGWLLGVGALPGVGHAGELVCPYVSPASIPCAAATWESVALDRERSEYADRWASQVRASWGGARVWRVVVRLHEWALDALLEGWCLRGKVRVESGVTDAIASDEAGGYIEGHVLGLAGLRWTDPSMIHAEATILVVQELPA